MVTGKKEVASLYALLADDKKEQMQVLINRLLLVTNKPSAVSGDFLAYLSYHFLELLIFSLEKHHPPLAIGLDLVSQRAENAILELRIKRFLKHNQNFIFIPYEDNQVVDGVITNKRKLDAYSLPTYQLKEEVGAFDLRQLEQFLKTLWQEKISQDG